MAQYFKIGKFVASTGLKGQLVLYHHLRKKNAFKEGDVIFLEEKSNSFIPYFVESVREKSNSETIIKLEGVDTMEIARKLTPKEVWLSEEHFNTISSSSAPISLLGFSIVHNRVSLGEIIEVIEQPHQILCTIILDGKEALIPVHEKSLEKIDKKNRKIFVILPDGLLDIYK